jgi:hypothetical protein
MSNLIIEKRYKIKNLPLKSIGGGGLGCYCVKDKN